MRYGLSRPTLRDWHMFGGAFLATGLQFTLA